MPLPVVRSHGLVAGLNGGGSGVCSTVTSGGTVSNDTSAATTPLSELSVNRDPLDVAEEWVSRALEGPAWEVRDNYPYEDGYKCWVERGVGEKCERFIDTPLTSAEACVIEHMLNVMRGDAE